MDKHDFSKLPAVGAWRLTGAYEGREVAHFAVDDAGVRIEGTSVGVEDGEPWSIQYAITVDKAWHFKNARIVDGSHNQLEIELDATGSWLVNGEPRPELQGCQDLDLEASVITNTMPVHRLALAEGQLGKSAAAYIRTQNLAVERLEQTYTRLPDADGQLSFEYDSPRFGYHDVLRFGADGLTEAYPGIGERIA
jgi:hypothetical protein